MPLDYKIVWLTEEIPTEIEMIQVRKEIDFLFEDIGTTSDLFFHTVMLGPEDDSPSVILYGIEGVDDTFSASYSKKTKWETL